MKRPAVVLAIILAAAALSSVSARADEGGLTAAAAGGVFPPGASLAGVELSGLEFGHGVLTGEDDTASGAFHAVLAGTALGQPRDIIVEGSVDAGFLVAGSATFSGTATVDLGGGALPLVGVPFSVSVGPDSLQLTVDATPLPAAALTVGAIAIE